MCTVVSKNTNRSDWTNLDEDIAALIFNKLDGKDLSRTRLACQKWSCVVKDNLSHIELRGSCIDESFHEHFPNLRSLSIVNEVSDTALLNLEDFEHLEHLELYDMSVAEPLSMEAVDAIASLPNLVSVEAVSCNSFTDQHLELFGPMCSMSMYKARDHLLSELSPLLYSLRVTICVEDTGLAALSHMKSLQWLNVGFSVDTHPGWLDPIKDLRLRVLCVNDCDYSSISSVYGMTSLEVLEMSDSSISGTDLSALESLTNLRRLDMSCCPCRRMSTSQLSNSIQKLTNLEYLNIHDTKIVENDLEFDEYRENRLESNTKPHGLLVSRKNSALKVLVAGERDFILEDMSRLPKSIERLDLFSARFRSKSVQYLMATLPNLSYIDVRFSTNVSISDLYMFPRHIEWFVTNKKLLKRFLEDSYPDVCSDPLVKDDKTGRPKDLVF